jgi:hypothetical protein
MLGAKIAKTWMTAVTLVGVSVAPAIADWQWVDEPTRVETRIYEERIEPSGPTDYYDQRPRNYYREEYRPVVVTDRETWWEGRCEVTRTYFSDGNESVERTCHHARPMWPHEYFIDRMGRHFDHLRGYD